VPLETISAILGHVDPEITIGYLGINLDDQAEAMLKTRKISRKLDMP
jgi:hypothetical protein